MKKSKLFIEQGFKYKMNKLHGSWRNYLTETKLRVFDFDDTLVKSDSKIKVTDPGGKQSTLTPGEYATHEKDSRNEYDFSEFDKLINPREVKKVTSILRNVVGAGTDGRQNVILTARDSVAEDSIQDYLEEIGIDTSKIDFVLLGDSAPIAKSRWIEDKIRTGATDVLFLDDSGKNVEAVLDLKEKYPDVKIDARRVGYAEEIEEQMLNEKDEHLIENVETLLKEVTDDEIAHIADVLNGLDPKDLAFNRLFGDKFRLAIDFPTLDTSSELGQFIELWRVMDYTVDWDKGTISGDRVLRDVSPAGFADQIFGMTAVGKGTQFKKINMKIGKWLAKLLGYQTKYQALRKEVEDYYSKEGPGAARGLWKQGPRPRGGYTGNQTEKALSEEDLKNYYRLESYIYMMARAKDDPFPQQLESVQSIQKLIFYWRDNAAYIKKNLDKASGNKYSIIITRHPLDVLRMSDFENIQSCHSPPSRGGPSKEYKCAVAEAHGHGAVAYVVNTEDLTSFAGADASIEDVNNNPDFQDGEIFFDDERPYKHEGTLAPYSRLRVRQVKYYEHTKDPETYDERNPYEGVELAVPEERRYGLQIPGLVERVVDWAKENQKEQIEGAPLYMTTRGGTKQIDLDEFIKFGGSYEDNVINRLIKKLWPKDENFGFNGSIVQDTDTEDNLPANLMMNLVDAYQEEVNDMAETKNNRMRYCEVGGTVYDDEMDEDGGGVYISCEGEMILKWHKSEWKSLPNTNQAEWIESELNELGHPWAELSDIGVQNYNVVVTFKILPQKLVGFGGQEYAWGPDVFEEFAQIVDTECDDNHASVKQVCEVFFKREGWMEGGAIVALGHEVLNGEYSSSEWDAEAEEGYEYGEMESVRFTTDVTISYADINDAIAGAAANYKGINEQTAPAIAESRQFRIALRKAMTEPVQEAVNKSYYPPIETETLSVSPTEIFIRIGYYASMDDPDGLVEVLKALVEYWDDWHNEIHDVIKKTFVWAARQAKVADQAAPGELSLEEQRLFDVEDMLRKPIVLKEREQNLPIPIDLYDVIYGYVIRGKQPDYWDIRKLQEAINSNEYPDWLRWYKGTAYRGMIVSDAWVSDWLSSHYSPDELEKGKEKLLSKHTFNLFKRFKGVIEKDVKHMQYGPSMRTRKSQMGSGGEYSPAETLAKEEKPMESWSRSYDVAKAYAVPTEESFYHQQSGFGKGLRTYLTDPSGMPQSAGVMSIILEADGKKESWGTGGGGTFLDMEPLYKLPGLAPESHIQEVPSLGGWAVIKRVHIPYKDFQAAYERTTKKWTERERERVSPYIKEAAEKAGIILF